MRLVRIEYWNPSTGTVRTGSTGHGESLTDMQTYLLPLSAQLAGSALGSGVVHGLEVTATVGKQGLTVGSGLALDGQGRPVLLSKDGAVVVDPNAPPIDQVQNVPLELVGSGGTELETSGLIGAQVLTLTAREALDPASGASSWSLVHAPWLRLVPQATFTDDGSSVPLALATLDATGAVTALDAGPRRQASPTVGSLTLRRTAVVGGQTPSVGASAGPSLRTRQDGGLDVVLPGSQAGVGLSVEGTTGNLLACGNVGIGTAAPTASLEVDRGTATTLGLKLSASGPGWGAGLQLGNQGATGRTYGTYAGDDGRWHFVDVSQGQDRVVVDAAGHVGIGTGTDPLAKVLHVTGSLHSGGADAGLSFMDRHVSGYVDAPTTGQRWVWYADGGYARLWSGTDQLRVGEPGDGGGLDVPRRMRVRQGADASSGIWFFQNAAPGAAFVGMVDDGHVGLWGQGVGWGLTMDISSGAVSTVAELSVGTGTRANLRVSGDATVGSGGNAALTTRHVNGKLVGNDGPDDLYLNWGTGKSVHVGGQKAANLEVHGNVHGARVTADGEVHGNVVTANGDVHANTLSANATITGAEGHFNRYLAVTNPANGEQSVLYSNGLSAAGYVDVGNTGHGSAAGMWSDGTIWGKNKKFIIPHPQAPDTKTLHHAALEGPEVAVYYRGEGRLSAGRAEVRLPEYFEALTCPEDRTILLTPKVDPDVSTPFCPLAASSIRNGRFTVVGQEEQNSRQEFYWEVKAVRNDIEPLIAEQPSQPSVQVDVLPSRD